jgi:hypothetical protein
MGRERRRRDSTARSRRTPTGAPGASTRELPVVPIVVVVGVVAVIGLLAYLIWQQGKDSGGRFASAAEVEKDPAPDLPGEYVNLPEIYADERGNASYGSDGTVPNTAPHVTGPIDYEAAGNTNPPAGGPHWIGGCTDDPETSPTGCGPAPWGIFRAPWPAATLVHNMEHGGMVVWYNTTDQAVIDDIESFARDLFPVVVNPYPDMEAETIALTTWGRIDKFPVSEYSRERIETFEEVHKCRFNPEDLPDC